MTLFQGRYRIESSRRPGWDYASPGWYFVTVCTQHKQAFLGEVIEEHVQLSLAGVIAQNELHGLPSHYDRTEIDCCVIMPDHIHAIIVIEGRHMFFPDGGPYSQLPAPGFPFEWPRPGSLSTIVRSYKAGVARLCRLQGLEFAWQAGFYDRVLRDDGEVNGARECIANNPRNWATP